MRVLEGVGKKERFQPPLPPEAARLLARSAGGNLRRALLSLEALHVQNDTWVDASVPLPDWETYIGNLAKAIVQAQSPDQLLKARGMLYELLVHCIPPSLILATLARRLLELTVDESAKASVVHWAAWYEHRLKLGSKPIFHLEGSSRNPEAGLG